MRLVAVLLLLLGFCACDANRPKQIKCEPLTDFSCTAECTQNDTAFTFDLSVEPDGSFSLYTRQPTLMDGVGFLYKDGNYTVDTNGMTDTFSQSAFSQKSPVRLLFGALKEFLFTGTETLLANTDGTFSAQKIIDNQSVFAVLTEDGRLTKIHCPDTDTSFTFTYRDVTE